MTEPKPEFPTKEQIDPIIKEAEKDIRVLVGEIEQIALPVTDAMAEQAKSLVTLSSSALVLSFSVLHLARPAIFAHAWMLATAWVLFALTVAVGAFWHYFYRDIRRYHMSLWLALQSLSERMLSTPVGPTWKADCLALTEKELHTISTENYSAIRNLNRCNIAMSLCFTLGLIALVGFGIANLPSSF